MGHEDTPGDREQDRGISRRNILKACGAVLLAATGIEVFYKAATEWVPQVHLRTDDLEYLDGSNDGTFPVPDDSQLVNRKLPAQPTPTPTPVQNPNPTEAPHPSNTPTPTPKPKPNPTPTPQPRKPTPTPSKPNNPNAKTPYKTNTPEKGDNSMRKLFWERLNNWFGPYFNQRDAEWYDDPLGNVGRKGTMGSSGCLVACVAMVWSHLTHEYRTPKDVNKHKDLFGAGSMAMNDPLPTLGGHKPREYHDISFDTLHALSKQGNALILELVWINNSGENVYHYVVGTNLDTDGTLLINDPWFGGAIGVRYGQYWSNNNFTGRAWAYK